MTGKQIIEIASQYLGKNGKLFCQGYGLPWGSHWCCAFVWYVFMKAKASKLFYGGQRTAYVPTAQAWLKAHCKHISMKDARAGDIVVFTWHGGGYNKQVGSRDHIGFIRKKGTSQVAYTIEGNTGGAGPTTSSVMKRTRSVQYIYGIYRPKYAEVSKKGLLDVAKQAKKRALEHHKYKLGGWSWKTGIECHGFTGTVFKECGYNNVYKILKKKGFWRKFNSDAYLGKYRVHYSAKGVPASKMLPGDILVTSKAGHHSAIYIGNGKCAEAVRKGTRVASVGHRFHFVYRVDTLCTKSTKISSGKSSEKSSGKTTAKKVVAHKKNYRVIAPAGMNIRKSHTRTSVRIGGIGYGQVFKATKKYGNWIYGTYGGFAGWVLTKAGADTYLKAIN